jgi:hypothetical protein
VFSVKIKWGKELFDNVDVNLDEEPMVFKAQVRAAVVGLGPGFVSPGAEKAAFTTLEPGSFDRGFLKVVLLLAKNVKITERTGLC